MHNSYCFSCKGQHWIGIQEVWTEWKITHLFFQLLWTKPHKTVWFIPFKKKKKNPKSFLDFFHFTTEREQDYKGDLVFTIMLAKYVFYL